MQVPLPIRPVSSMRAPATRRTVVDYAVPTLRPCSPSILASLLGSIHRYGVCGSAQPGRAITVLHHSVACARLAQDLRPWILQVGELGEAEASVVPLYAALHDIGGVFGGDVVAMVPGSAKASLQAYQAEGRANCERAMGLPLPSARVAGWVALVDRLVTLPEQVRAGIAGSTHEAIEENDRVLGWRLTTEAAFRQVGLAPEGPAWMHLVSEAEEPSLLPRTLRQAQAGFRAACQVPTLVLLSQAGILVGVGRVTLGEPGRQVDPGAFQAWIGEWLDGRTGTVHVLSTLGTRGAATTWDVPGRGTP